jgi:hypothetical protein
LGFLSGIGYEGEEVIDPLMGLDPQAVWAWVDDYCQAHPVEKIAAAAEACVSACNFDPLSRGIGVQN